MSARFSGRPQRVIASPGGCIHTKTLADVDVKVLSTLIGESVKLRKAKS